MWRRHGGMWMTKMIRGLENEMDVRLKVKAIEVFSLKETKE